MADIKTNLCHLPQEILEQVLKNERLCHKDLCNVSRTCCYLSQVSRSNELWRTLFKRRYPVLYRMLELSKVAEANEWRDHYKCRHIMSRSIRQENQLLSPRFYHRMEVPDSGFNSLVVLEESHPFGEMFVKDELMSLIHEDSMCDNLTEKYYAAKVLQFFETKRLKGKWRELLGLPCNQQSLEKGAIFIAQWCQTWNYISEMGICEELDVIASQVKATVNQRHSSHPLVQLTLPCFSELNADYWSVGQSRQILDCLNLVLYTELGFYGNEEDYYDMKNSFIDKVLETRRGIPITLSIIYASIARRLGVLCEPVNFPSHFLLRWKEYPADSENSSYSYIDAFDRGKRLSQLDLHSVFPQLFHVLTRQPDSLLAAVEPVKVFERMARNLVNIARQRDRAGGDAMSLLRNVVDLFVTICPEDMNMNLLLVRISTHLGINLTQMMERLQTIPMVMGTHMLGELTVTMEQLRYRQVSLDDDDDQNSVVVKKRKPRSKVEFSVGLIMRHKRYNYTCVIYGWDEKCESSREWIEQMGVYNLPNKDKQPFYNVLVEDGSNRYAAQENLTHCPQPVEVTHPEIGKYFRKFTGYCYMMNAEKQAEYPEDMDLTIEANPYPGFYAFGDSL
ncbi:F-box only protein 21-like [Tubulanus polymorphus]|uniref:F-box only protein 21-like n=1 Tax=Tubulanus polymorphus TaxID=672921 RepID=UPI003DA24DAE